MTCLLKPQTRDMENKKIFRLRAVQMYQAGMSIHAISRELGKSRTWIRYWLRKYRESSKHGFSPDDGRLEAAISDIGLRTGEPIKSVARRYGVDYYKLYYFLRSKRQDLLRQREEFKNRNYNRID